MNNQSILEECFNKFTTDINRWLPDGLIQVDLDLLHQLSLLHYYNKNYEDPALTRYFYVVDSIDKITLVNDQFVIWITPDKNSDTPKTYTLIALNRNDEIHLELAFVTQGIYNQSRLVLSLVEKFLVDTESTEEMISKYKDR